MHRTGVVSQRLVLQVVHTKQLDAETCRCELSPSVSRPLVCTKQVFCRCNMTPRVCPRVLIIFIEISAITNFKAVTFTHPSSKPRQQILSTKTFNHSAVMLTMFVSDFVPFFVAPCFFVRCLFVQPCSLPLCENI